MKWILLLASIAGPRNTDTHYPQPHAGDGKTDTSQETEPIFSGVDFPIQPVSRPDDTYREHYAPKRKRDDPQWWGVWVNTVIASFTLATLLLLRGQINAVRNTERAFLIPQWNNETWINPRHFNNEEMNCCFVWKFKNCGKTPAFIDEAFGDLVLVKSLDAVPKKPVYGKGWVYYGDPLIRDGMVEGGPFLAELKDERPFDEIKDEYRREKKVLYAYGYVRYRDMFNRSHETRFGVRLAISPHSMTEDQFVVAGRKFYNKYT